MIAVFSPAIVLELSGYSAGAVFSLDRADVIAVLKAGIFGIADNAPGSCASNVAAVGTILDYRLLGSGVSRVAGNSSSITGSVAAGHRTGKGAVLDCARLHLSHNAAHIAVGGTYAALHIQVLNGGPVDQAEQTLVALAAVDRQAADRVAVPVKGAGVGTRDIAVRGRKRFPLLPA